MQRFFLLVAMVLFLSSCQEIYFAWNAATAFTSSPNTIYAPVSEPTSIRLTHQEDYKSVDPKKTITILIANDSSIYAYAAKDISRGNKYSYQNNSIRKFITEKKKVLGKELVVFIKTAPDASYKNTVNMLDEMTVNNIKKYSLSETTPEEKSYLKSLK